MRPTSYAAPATPPQWNCHAPARAIAVTGRSGRELVLEADGQADDAYAALAECWDCCTRHGLALEYGVLGPDLARLALPSSIHQMADVLELARIRDAPSAESAEPGGSGGGCRLPLAPGRAHSCPPLGVLSREFCPLARAGG
jgi:hypothetical protein